MPRVTNNIMHGCVIKEHVQSDSYALYSEYVLFKHSFCLAQTALFLQPRNKYCFVSSLFFSSMKLFAGAKS